MNTVIDPESYKVLFQHHASISKFCDMSNLTCYEKLARRATPCSFYKMPETAEMGTPTAREVPLLNDEYLLAHWAKIESAADRLRSRVTTLTMLPELAALRTPPVSLTCSVGVAFFPIHASIPSDLAVAADAAVSVAKRTEKSCVRMAKALPPLPLPFPSPLVRP